MNGYLVLARCITDDIPLRLFASADEATEFAEQCNDRLVRETAVAVLKIDVSEVVCVAIVEFVEGIPFTVTIVGHRDDS